MTDYSLTERGEFLAENSYVLWKAKGHLQKLSVSETSADYGVDRDEKEKLLTDISIYIEKVAELAIDEIPVDGGKVEGESE